MGAILQKYWPYDEVSVEEDRDPECVIISAPWLKIRLRLPPAELNRARSFLAKLSKNKLQQSDLEEVNWFFASLNHYPLAYTLPRACIDGIYPHHAQMTSFDLESPQNLLLSLTSNSTESQAIAQVANNRLPHSWSWDCDAAAEFSKSEHGLDPISLFSVARRFHLLNDIENNQTAALIDYVQGLKDDQALFRKASALVLRQNHYITEQCESVLKGALPTSGGSEDRIAEFIQAESGHDRILAKAIRSLGVEPNDIIVLPVTKTLMELFRFIAKTNLLAFAMVVDIFERTSYRDEDPVTSMLKAGGEHVASRQTDIHREINDQGGHENVAVGFLEFMAPVGNAFAREALLLAELATLVIHQLSVETLEKLQDDSSNDMILDRLKSIQS